MYRLSFMHDYICSKGICNKQRTLVITVAVAGSSNGSVAFGSRSAEGKRKVNQLVVGKY